MSISARSSAVKVISPATAFSRTCAGSVAFGIEMTEPLRMLQAIATCAGVALCRFATAASAGERNSRPPCPTGEYAMIGMW